MDKLWRVQCQHKDSDLRTKHCKECPASKYLLSREVNQPRVPRLTPKRKGLLLKYLGMGSLVRHGLYNPGYLQVLTTRPTLPSRIRAQ